MYGIVVIFYVKVILKIFWWINFLMYIIKSKYLNIYKMFWKKKIKIYNVDLEKFVIIKFFNFVKVDLRFIMD